MNEEIRQKIKAEGNEWWGEGMVIYRHPDMLHLCGYVRVLDTHPYAGRDYDDVPLSVHGEVTWSKAILPWDDAPSEEGYWWFGFDCAHWNDISPGFRWGYPPEATYKDMEYVRAECMNLARQLVRTYASIQ